MGTLFSGALSAAATIGLGIAGAAIITAFYFLRLRRREVVVPFAPLWLGAAGEQRSTKWARRLRHWLSLALALAIFALILIAAADPRPAASAEGRSLVLLIDRSASMSAGDEPESRLAAAKARAIELVEGLPPADRTLVASFGSDTIAESGFEEDRGRLRRAIAAVAPSEEPGDLRRAFAFAAAILRGRPHPTIVLVSDGGFSEDARSARPAGVDLRYLPVGRRGSNVGIVSFAARRIPADPGSVDAALVVENFGGSKQAAFVELLAGGTIVERVRLELGPRERRRHELPNVFSPDARLEARLQTAPDDLALDDRAFAVIPPLPRRRVLNVGPRDLYLDGALLSLGRTVTVERMAPKAAEAIRDRWGDYDLVIWSGPVPAPPPTEGRFLNFAPEGPGNPFIERGRVRDPVIAEVRRDHPLVRQVDLGDVNIAEARRWSLAAGDVTIAGSFGLPLIVERRRGPLRILATSFDPRRSDLPMRPAFPLLIANALARTAERPEGSVVLAAVTGAALRPASGGPEVPISRIGFHRLGDEVIAANLGDPRESDTTPAKSLTVGGTRLSPPDPPLRRPRIALGLAALALAGALLVFEWFAFHRRWTS